MDMICDRCEKLIVPGTVNLDLFRLNLISEGGESFLMKTVCRGCAEAILKVLTPFKKVKGKRTGKQVVEEEKAPKKKGLLRKK